MERRRQWTPEEKAALLAEVEATGGRISVVARRHGISKSLLYNWRSAWKAAALVARGAAPRSAGFIQLGVVADPSYERPTIRMASGAASACSRGMSIHGWSAPEAGEVVQRAAAVGRRLESSADVAPAIANLWLYDFCQGRFDRAIGISGDLFRIAGELDDSEILLQAHHCAWPTEWHRGSFALASEHVEASLYLYGEKRHAHHRHLYLDYDPAVCGLGIDASLQVALGYPDRAARREAESITLARKLEHPSTLAIALWFVCESRAARGDARGIFGVAQELLELSEERGIPQSLAHALIAQGWAQAVSGDVSEGIAKLQEAIGILSKIGHLVFLARAYWQMSEALAASRRHAAGLERVGTALDLAEATGMMLFVPRLHMTRSELLLQASSRNAEAAEASLHQALSVARQQGARAARGNAPRRAMARARPSN